MQAAPYIDELPQEVRTDRLSTVALSLAVVPWGFCALGVLAFALGLQPPAAILASGWLLSFFVGVTGAFIGAGLPDRRAKVAAALGFSAPLVTLVPTAFLVLYAMAGWCC